MENYPFLYFFSVVVLPLAWWITTIELAIVSSSNQDERFVATFGQVRDTTIGGYITVFTYNFSYAASGYICHSYTNERRGSTFARPL